jgi:hypothetical protein
VWFDHGDLCWVDICAQVRADLVVGTEAARLGLMKPPHITTHAAGNHHRTGASNGPTEGMNFCAKQVKRAGRGFTRFSHYRLRVLLHAGGVT